jgi:hypothetical protein
MAQAPVTPYGAGDPFPKPILQTHFEPVHSVDDSENYEQATAVAVTAVIGIAIWVLGFVYILLAVATHGNA